MFGIKPREELWDDPVGNRIKSAINGAEQQALNKAESIRHKWTEDLPDSTELHKMFFEMDALFLL